MVKLILRLILSLTLGMGSCQRVSPISQTQPPSKKMVDPLDLAWEDRSIFLPGLVSAYHAVVKEMTRASVYHLQFEIDADLTHIRGTEEVHYVNNEHGQLKEILFRLFPNILGGEMQVSQVLANGQSITPDYQLANSLIIIPLPMSLEPGRSVDITLDFTLRVPESVVLNYGVLASAENVLTLAHAYPMIAVYDEDGWNTNLPPQWGDVSFADMSFFIVKITAPRDLKLVGVGREISRTEIGKVQVVYYAAGPVRDFYLAASTAFLLESEQNGETRVNFYTPASAREGARQGLRTTVQALQIFNKRYIPYPYTELDLVATPTAALGIEYPGMIAIAERIISPGDMVYESTIVHEVGHQWFYNLIGSDQVNDPWLDESLAQYLTLQYYADQYGEYSAGGFRQSLENRWERVNDRSIPIGLPVEDYSNLEYGAIVYGRGPLFIEALDQKMGHDVFDEFLQDYARSYAWSIATPDAFRTLAESHCECDLSSLFDHWVFP